MDKISAIRGVNKAEIKLTSEELRSFNVTSGLNAGHIPSGVYNTPFLRPSLVSKLGVTVLENMDSRTDIPYSKGFDVQILVEEAPYTPNGITRTSAPTIKRRFQGMEVYTREYLAEEAAFDMIIADVMFSLEQVALKEIFDKIDASTITANSVTNVAKEVDTSLGLFKPAIITDKDTFITNASDIEMIAHFEGIFKATGTPIYGSDLVTNTIFTDFSQAVINWFGDLQLIIDPFTQSTAGKVLVKYIRFGDTAINPYTSVKLAE